MILRTRQEITEIIIRMNSRKEKHADIYKDMNKRLEDTCGLAAREYKTERDLNKIKEKCPGCDFSLVPHEPLYPYRNKY